jgi:hypothetical protein
MSLISLSRKPAAVQPSQGGAREATPDIAALNATASQAIERYIASQGLKADSLDVKYDGATQTVTVSGVAPTRRPRRRSSCAAATLPRSPRSTTC